MVYDPVHAIKGAHASYAVVGFVIALSSGITGYEEAKASLKAESSNSGAQNNQASRSLNVLARLLGLAFRCAYLAYLRLVILGLKLLRTATGRD
jgi:hypothetical protein